MFLEPAHRRVLRSLHAVPLLLVIRVAPDRETVCEARIVVILVRDAERRDLGVGVFPHLRTERVIKFGSDDLRGNDDRVDLLFGEARGVRSGDGVHETIF